MIKINNLKNIKTYYKALGSTTGKIKFYGFEEFTPNYSLYDVKHKYVTTSNIDKLDNIIKIKNKNNKVFFQIEIKKSNKKKVFNF